MFAQKTAPKCTKFRLPREMPLSTAEKWVKYGDILQKKIAAPFLKLRYSLL